MNVTRLVNHVHKGTELRIVRRGASILAVVAVALGGAWLGIVLGAHIQTPVGPADIGMSLRPSMSGETVVDVRPLGTLGFDTHNSPLRLDLTFDGVHPEVAQQILDNPRWADRLPQAIETDLQDGLRRLVIQSVAFAVLGAALAGLVVFRGLRKAAWAGLTGLLAVALIAGLSAATFNAKSISEPRYTGLLTGVPSLIGDAESIVTRFSEYRGQLAKLVTNVSQLYQAGSTLPLFKPDPDTIRVLHVSDIHLNPVAWNIIRSLRGQFKINLIIDTGDISDHGTKAENKFMEEIGDLRVPYVFVRGNHDSKTTERAVARQKNAIVLNGTSATVAGLRIYGIGDPRFTPDKATEPISNEKLAEIGATHASRVVPPEWPRPPSTSAPDRIPADIVAVHDPTMGRPFSGKVALILSGHVHDRSTELLPTGTRLMIQGSTGGAGLRGLEHEEPTPFMASVLYFRKSDGRLQAWDDITLGGLGQQSVQIERHLETDPARTINPESPASSPPTGAGGRTPTPSTLAG
ncbi:metallophosphoesterase [Thermopolyspora sp. NPDC052614]|uniref:metallophosphoesterase family protein n=1 Tax=Thermopolyspora sp. NPDC052614 TaxID=3155682 RepID=UPI00342ECFFF